jgi:hypothetical protein
VARIGTAFCRLRTPGKTATLMVMWLAKGCPFQLSAAYPKDPGLHPTTATADLHGRVGDMHESSASRILWPNASLQPDQLPPLQLRRAPTTLTKTPTKHVLSFPYFR